MHDTAHVVGSVASRESEAVLALLDYCTQRDWAGHDPYDALNSRLFKVLPVLDSRWPRLVLIQVLKRSPVNVRRILLVPRVQNAKGLALGLRAVLALEGAGLLPGPSPAAALAERLEDLRSPGVPAHCWGYSFPWQTRTHLVPRGAPNLVCTVFVAGALLDAYDATRESRYLAMASSAAGYIVEQWFREEGALAYFAYPLPDVRQQIHNANFLAAAFLCRVAHATGDRGLLAPALKAARYSVSCQRPDGSWPYGELPAQAWIDNFHTGYNLSGLRAIGRYTGTTEFEPAVRRGFEFYRRHFIRPDGAARYFHDRTYPIDAHCIAQSVLTLLELQDLHPENVSLARRVSDWALTHMWDDRGFFYYRQLRTLTIRTSYMRWTQAWMLLALATLVAHDAGATARDPA